MQAFYDQLRAHVPIKDSDWNALLEHWTFPKQLKRNEYLSDIGQIERHLFWIESGTLKICYLQNGTEICSGFGYPETLICSYPSFILNRPAEYYIQAITPCKLVGISRSHFYEIIENNIRLERAWRKITEFAILGKIEREIDLASYTPEERFLRLWQRSPHLFQLIPQKYIASYLRMKPETFSRIKHKVWKH